MGGKTSYSQAHTIELKKFSGSTCVQLCDLVSKIKTSLDLWVAFLTRHDLLNKDNLPKEINQKTLQKALTVLDVMNFTQEERQAYGANLKWYQIEANTLKKAEAKGEERGIAIGEARGIVIGEARGIQKMVLAMLTKGCNLDLISHISGMEKTEIDKLLKQQKELIVEN